MAIFQFEGIYTPIITPFYEDGSVNYDALADMVDYLIGGKMKVHGIISGGSTGENYAKTTTERIAVAKFIAERIKKRVPFMVGTGTMISADSVALARAAREIGADAILIASPPYAVPTERENALNALHIEKHADLPVMLYNYPGRMGVTMGEEFLNRVGRSRNICAIKESSGDINRLHLLARDYPHIQIACGMDDQALEFFAWGARCWVCGGSNFLLPEHLALYEACVVEGDFAKGRKIMSAMMPLMRILEQGGKFIQNIKYGVMLNGIDAGAMRPPLKSLNKDDKRALEQVLKVLRQTIDAVNKVKT